MQIRNKQRNCVNTFFTCVVFVFVFVVIDYKGNNKITELRTILSCLILSCYLYILVRQCGDLSFCFFVFCFCFFFQINYLENLNLDLD